VLYEAEKRVYLDKLKVQDIIESVCVYFDMSSQIVNSVHRSIAASFLRGVIGYIIINHSKTTLAELAKKSGKSQSTLSRSSKNISSRIINDDELRAHIDMILHRLATVNASLQH